MCQHDFDGRRIFQHRNNAKWQLPSASNPRISGFSLEQECIDALARLEARWCGQVRIARPDHPDAEALERHVLEIGRFVYHRVGHDERELQLCADQTIELVEGRPAVCITSDQRHQVTCALRRDERGFLVGRWAMHETMPIELVPIHLASAESLARIEGNRLREYFLARKFVAIHPRVEQVVFEFERGSLRSSPPRAYRSWQIELIGGRGKLRLETDDGRATYLTEDPDRVWRSEMQGAVCPCTWCRSRSMIDVRSVRRPAGSRTRVRQPDTEHV